MYYRLAKHPSSWIFFVLCFVAMTSFTTVSYAGKILIEEASVYHQGKWQNVCKDSMQKSCQNQEQCSYQFDSSNCNHHDYVTKDKTLKVVHRCTSDYRRKRNHVNYNDTLIIDCREGVISDR